MPVTRGDLLRWQFDLTWSLFEYHLERLEPADFLWEPAAHCWTVRPTIDGGWVPDWADSVPDPIPVPTIGWLTWHIGWWWTTAIGHARGDTPPDRAAIHWPGAGEPTVTWLRELRTEWLAVLDGLTEADLDHTAPFPWQHDPEHTLAHMLAWLNAELMKNAAEIGQLRLLRAAVPR
ncbi:DinB family protein [Micromonospora sp. NBC_01796]|uniref:DinB family protein n=1 Tax=Micromonospora sp. NBC_01796 TaxID=2975987 RepID=UPI002DD982C5|nr:DinB family protein [Micromonospora sp. NBC_01796]WSA89478.1 DinB family protein [Micromonospora sp. NBC_01796]